jgi:hypothetical protein
MAAVFQALGLSSSTPSPDAYNNQIAEDENLKSARSNCETLKSTLCLAVNIGKLSGVDTTTMQARCDDITALCKSNLSSAEIAQKTKEFALAAKDTRASTLADQKKGLTEILTKTTARVATVKANNNIPAELVAKYTALNDEVVKGLDAIKATDPLDETKPLPVIRSAEEILITLDDLDNEYEEVLTKTANTGRRLWNRLRSAMPYITIVFVILGAILGGIILANKNVSEPFWLLKIYYFVYGAGLFPISLMTGAYSPPEWKSGLIPIQLVTPPPPLSEPSGPAPEPIPVPPPPPVSLGGLTLPKLPTGLPKVTLPVSLPKVTLPTLPKITFPKMFGGGEGETGPIKPTSRAGMFTYADGAQFMSKNVLRGLAITELIVLGLIGAFYGVDKFAFKLS